MDRRILRDELKEAIKNRTVLAAVFHTFNFDPRFFEHHVMPLLVPTENFSNDQLKNEILWRACAKKNSIPPIAVYCDYYAKSNTEAPSLDYDMYCIRLPFVPGKICNFHPKHGFLLLKDERQRESLLILTGSANLTPSGWCDNIECFSILEIAKTKRHPNVKRKNTIQQYLDTVNRLAGLKTALKAELPIMNFLNYTDLNVVFVEPNHHSKKKISTAFYTSTESAFETFLDGQIFSQDQINTVEIVSPYFSTHVDLVRKLTGKEIKHIKCLIPASTSNKITINKDCFIALQEAGLIWCYWKDKKMNTVVRNQHSKIYRFYGERFCYTFIGSVNFTEPAWCGFTPTQNQGNIETGILYRHEHETLNLLQKVKNTDPEQLDFDKTDDLEFPQNEHDLDRQAPHMSFTIHWRSKELKANNASKGDSCFFHQLIGDQPIPFGNSTFNLEERDLQILSRNALIQIKVNKGAANSVYSYYPMHQEMDQKPFSFNLGFNTTMKYWDFLDNEFEQNALTERIARETTNESGAIDFTRLKSKSLINEMGSSFTRLSNLETYLLQHKKLSNLEFEKLRYYLDTENIDTLPYFLLETKREMEEGLIQKSFYWMITQIATQMIFMPAIQKVKRQPLDPLNKKSFVSAIQQRIDELEKHAATVKAQIPGLQEKASWIVDQIKTEYE